MRALLILFVFLFTLPVQAQTIGIVTNSVGQVSWLRAGDGVQLQRGDPVSLRDSVTTAASARVVLRMNDGSVITVGGDSQLILADWQFSADADDNSARLELVEGAFRFVTGLITRQDDPQLSVDTPSGTIGVRGTDFWGGYLDAGVLDVVLLDGEHRLEVRNDLGSVLIAEPCFGVPVDPGQPPAAVQLVAALRQ